MRKATEILGPEKMERLLNECNRTMPRFLISLLGALENIEHLAADTATRGKEIPDIDTKIGFIATKYDLEDLESILKEFYEEEIDRHRGAHS